MASISGPYRTTLQNGKFRVDYAGNKVFPPMSDVLQLDCPTGDLSRRVDDFVSDPIWGSLFRINHTVFSSAVAFLAARGALFVPLPLTTRMISSPGAQFGPKRISYTTDTCPVTLQWFNEPRTAFLSESSQIYLELALMQPSVREVFSIYNSFRKEPSDATHLAEFHHIEFEGVVSNAENQAIILSLLCNIAHRLTMERTDDLRTFLTDEEIAALADFSRDPQIAYVTFQEAIDALYCDTRQDRYKRFTLDGTLGAEEEVRLTEIFGKLVAVKNFPLLEVPFYHAEVPSTVPAVADNADFIWPGYREVVGSGRRVDNTDELRRKAMIFELPDTDYRPYLRTRELPGYRPSCGFGLGWERLLQGVLRLPFIWSGAPFPRISQALAP